MKRSSIKVGTRGSALAMAQTQLVIDKLRAARPDLNAVAVPIKTTGDRIKTAAALRTAGKGLFTKEIERALLKRKIDCAVHSLKDLPTTLPEGLELGAVLVRGEAADAFVGRDGTPLEKLPPRTQVGTGSLRRQALLSAAYPHLRFVDLRGNLDTRLEKLRQPRSGLGGIVVAAAGLDRLLGDKPLARQLIDKHLLVPSAGQGALAVEIRANDQTMRDLLEPIHDPLTAAAVAAERALLRRLEGGCQIPLGVYAEAFDDGTVRVIAALATLDGSHVVRAEATGTVEDPETVSEALASMLRDNGAEAVLDTLRGPRPKRARASSNGHGHRNGHGRAKKARSRAGRRRR